jgi:hypothetical protein
MTRKAILLLFIAVAFSAFFAFTGKAMGQGCGLGVVQEDFLCCNLPHFQSDCGFAANPNDFCLVGFGNCCGMEYTVANTHFDDKCAGILTRRDVPGEISMPDYHPRIFVAGRCGPGGGLRAAETFIALEPRASYSNLATHKSQLIAKELK